ncbi:hypothetical protein [Pseudoxanthomonas kalamensis]|uniref:hypothetical protein n=1 Tax=Pseudoxanthomonas kalamensis TaxID=289483 RepID=UPI001390A9BA|nr:hypothetical protein [Pseudoxanthomonas kalamensis]
MRQEGMLELLSTDVIYIFVPLFGGLNGVRRIQSGVLVNHRLLFAFFLTFSGIANAQVFTYDNEGEVFGAAMMSLHTKAPLVDKVMSYCANEGAIDDQKAVDTTNAWKKRNASYLALAPILLEEMHQTAVREKQVDAWHVFIESTMPKQIELASSILVDQLKALPEISQRRTMCMNLSNAIDSGRLDHANEDPAIQTYLNKRLLSKTTK